MNGAKTTGKGSAGAFGGGGPVEFPSPRRGVTALTPLYALASSIPLPARHEGEGGGEMVYL